MQKLKLLPSYLLVLLGSAFFGKLLHLYIWLREHSYQELLQVTQTRYLGVYWMEVLDQEFFTPERHQFLLLGLPVLLVFLGMGLGIGWFFRGRISEHILRFLRESYVLFTYSLALLDALEPQQKKTLSALILLILGHRLYGWNTSMFGGDELFSFLHFVHQGPALTAMYYPVPNNHVGFNLLCSFLHFVITDAFWVMRLLPWLSNLVLLYILLVGGLRFWGFGPTLWMLLLVAFAIPSQIYVYYGRGYSPMATLHLLSIFSLMAYMSQARLLYRQIFLLCSVLGLYMVPVYIFPLSSSVLWLIWEQYRSMHGRERLSWIVLGVQIVFITFVLYSPVFFFSGPGAIAGNRYVVPWETDYFIRILPAGLAETLDYLLYLPGKSYYLLPGILLLLVWILRTRGPEELQTRRWFRFLIASALILLLATLAMKRIAPYRTWTPLVSPVFMGIALALGFVAKRIPQYLQGYFQYGALLSISLIFLLQQITFYRETYQDMAQDAVLQDQVQFLMSLKPRYGLISTMEEDPYELHMRWYMIRRGIPWDELKINGPYRAIPWKADSFDFIILWESRELWAEWKTDYRWAFSGKLRHIYVHKKHQKPLQDRLP